MGNEIDSRFEPWTQELLSRNNCTDMNGLSSEMISDEIDEIKGAIDNERLWTKGAPTPDVSDMHRQNIQTLREYMSFLTELKNSKESVGDIKQIRFIDTHYNELFRIPDGGRIVVTRPEGELYPGVQEQWVGTCKYLDDSHTQINDECFHICQFAEKMERIGAAVQPETEPEMVSGYRITRRVFVGDKVFKFGVNPNAAQPYATWQGYRDPARGNDWGHYWSDRSTANRDFFLRINSERTGQPYDHTTLIKQRSDRGDAR